MVVVDGDGDRIDVDVDVVLEGGVTEEEEGAKGVANDPNVDVEDGGVAEVEDGGVADVVEDSTLI